MKIALICYNHFDATIPLGRYLTQKDKNIEVEFIFLLSRSNLNVEIIDLKNQNLDTGFVPSEKVESILDKEIFNYLNYKVNFNIFLFSSIKLADTANYRLLFQLKNKIAAEKYDVIHFVGNSPWIIFLNQLIRNTPKIHTLHEPYPFSALSKYRLLRHKWKINLLISSGSHITVPSAVSYNRFKSHFKINPDKVSIIPFGVFEIYKEYASADIVKKDNVILFYGHISEYKGIEILIKAMEKVSAADPDIKLIIAGGGRFDYDTKGLNGNTTIINKYLSNKEIAALNQTAALVVCPYTSASQSGVVMTSFAFGNPIIASNVGALPEVIEHENTGIIIEPGNPDVLSETILNLFRDPETIKRLKANVNSSFSRSEKSWLKLTEQTYQLYLRLLNEIKNLQLEPSNSLS